MIGRSSSSSSDSSASRAWTPWVAAGLVLAMLGPMAAGRLSDMFSSGQPAQDFSLPVVGRDGGLTGDRLRLADQRGQVVVVDFWATWCPPCRASMPVLQRVHQRFQGRGVNVIGVNVDEQGPALVPEMARRLGVDYTMLYDGGDAQRAYDVQALPTLFLIDREGRVRHVHRGMLSESDLAARIEQLLGS